MTFKKTLFLSCFLLTFTACGGDNDEENTSVSRDVDINEDINSSDTNSSDSDTFDSDNVDTPDTTLEDTTLEDIELGDVGFGEPCEMDQECASGICIDVPGGSACSIACEGMNDCENAGISCQALRPGLLVCMPDAAQAVACTSHEECSYPLTCLADLQWCETPECSLDGDCNENEICDNATRRCRPEVCNADLDCRRPEQYCVDGVCGAPNCEQDGDCQPEEICQPVQHRCITPLECEDQEGCAYNQLCEGGRCLPTLCFAECSIPGDLCDPETGRCGKECSSHQECNAGQACRSSSGICYDNTVPFAEALISGELVGSAQVGATITLDARNSVDPEGEQLSFLWQINALPVDSALTIANNWSSAEEVVISPDVSGRYAFGLWTKDPAGLVSTQAQVVLWVTP